MRGQLLIDHAHRFTTLHTALLLGVTLCFVYLLFLPFNMWGMSILIGLGAVAMFWLGRPDDVVTTGITTMVVMVVAAISPHHARMQPIFRVFDTFIGTGVGLIGALMTPKATVREPECGTRPARSFPG